nr:cytochrome c biogenesis protein ResB [Brevibacterium daeguense]
MLRWAWRQLTTMRVALILLLILALAAIPGSLLPQRIQDPIRVSTFIEENGAWGEFLDRVQLFDVYSSIWFSSVYILLMISLVGCVLPRTNQHWKAMRQDPPRAPRRLSRMPGYQTFRLAVDPDAGTDRPSATAAAGGSGAADSAAGGPGDSAAAGQSLLGRAQQRLKKQGYRTVRLDDHIAAERGYLRETGNLVFHASLLLLVVTMAVGSLFGYSGQRVLVEGDTFTNSLVSYDSFEPGTYFDASRLDDFRLRLNSFESTFDDQATGSQFGQPRSFEADITEFHEGRETRHLLEVNQPIRVGGTGVYLTGNGYAPVFTTRDSQGTVTFSGPVVFIPQPEASGYGSRGVVKVPDAEPDQLGFVGFLLPTAGLNDNGELISRFAELRNPYVVMNVYRGDLGLDDGIPQSVYELEADDMVQVTDASGSPVTLEMAPGETVELPDGLGSITLEGVDRFVALDIRHNPTQGLMLVLSIFLLIGLGLSLFVPRRRMWVRVTDREVEVAALARGEDPRSEHAAKDLALELQD